MKRQTRDFHKTWRDSTEIQCYSELLRRRILKHIIIVPACGLITGMGYPITWRVKLGQDTEFRWPRVFVQAVSGPDRWGLDSQGFSAMIIGIWADGGGTYGCDVLHSLLDWSEVCRHRLLDFDSSTGAFRHRVCC